MPDKKGKSVASIDLNNEDVIILDDELDVSTDTIGKGKFTAVGNNNVDDDDILIVEETVVEKEAKHKDNLVKDKKRDSSIIEVDNIPDRAFEHIKRKAKRKQKPISESSDLLLVSMEPGPSSLSSTRQSRPRLMTVTNYPRNNRNNGSQGWLSIPILMRTLSGNDRYRYHESDIDNDYLPENERLDDDDNMDIEYNEDEYGYFQYDDSLEEYAPIDFDNELEQASNRPRTRSRTGRLPLTDRERQISMLASRLAGYPDSGNSEDSYEALLRLCDDIGDNEAGLSKKKMNSLVKNNFNKNVYLEAQKRRETNLEKDSNGSKTIDVDDNIPTSDTCPVCMEEFKRNESLLGTPCKHWFHSKCITKWFRKSTKCPICRAIV